MTKRARWTRTRSVSETGKVCFFSPVQSSPVQSSLPGDIEKGYWRNMQLGGQAEPDWQPDTSDHSNPRPAKLPTGNCQLATGKSSATRGLIRRHASGARNDNYFPAAHNWPAIPFVLSFSNGSEVSLQLSAAFKWSTPSAGQIKS